MHGFGNGIGSCKSEERMSLLWRSYNTSHCKQEKLVGEEKDKKSIIDNVSKTDMRMIVVIEKK